MGRAMKEVTWVVIKDGSILCERCGVVTAFPLPMKLSRVTSYLRGIAAAHRDCEAPAGDDVSGVEVAPGVRLGNGARRVSSEKA